jgi:Na+-driven multidrug efflux pump
VYRYFATGLIISLVLAASVAFWHVPILSLFTQDRVLLGMVAAVLFVAVVHEPGRNFNTIIIPALKGAGDIRFPVYVGILSMWGVSAFGSWLLGLKLGLGLVGVWVAMACDEWLRGLIMLRRWYSGAWKSRAFVTPSHPASPERASIPPVPSPALLSVAEE